MQKDQLLERLDRLERQLYAYRYAMGLMEYDGETAAPLLSAAGRGEALALLSEVEYRLTAGPETAELLAALEQIAPALTLQQAAQLRELQKAYDRNSKVPQEEYTAYSRLLTLAQPAWRQAKQNDDFDAFAPYLRQIVETNIRFAGYYAPGRDPYDTWLDQYEPGMTRAQLDGFFEALRREIVPLVQRITAEGASIDDRWAVQGDWPLEGQKQLARRVMDRMGIDPARCALGETEHPFTTNFSRDDVRITTHYYPENLLSSLYSVIHEGGHALYELNTAPRLAGTCLATGASMGMHESQSRLYENLIGRSRAFADVLWQDITACFPAQTAGRTAEDFWKAANKAQPSLIRTEADELTYCLHIMVRYELEKQLFDRTLTVEELPAAWNARMEEYLGVKVPNNAQGVLQDVHWAGGSFGYFPSYALGSAYGAQILDAMRRQLDVDALTARGELAPITAWLTDRIYQYGAERTPAWLLENACGAPFDPTFYTRYLKEKFTALYGLG